MATVGKEYNTGETKIVNTRVVNVSCLPVNVTHVIVHHPRAQGLV